MNNSVNSIREALNDAGFDWDNGKVYKPSPGNTGKGLVQIANDDPYFDGKSSYYALDGTFVYVSAFMNFFGREGIFPGKARVDSVEEIEINVEKYFEGNTLKKTLVSIANDLTILSMVDVQGLNKDVKINIVGSKEVLFFVCCVTGEENAIKLFMDRVLRSARLSVLERTMERQMLVSMLPNEGSQC